MTDEAALAYTRARGPQEEQPAPLTATEAAAAEAIRQAAAEGLTLKRSDNAAGFRGVSRERSRFMAQ
jgi:hypothetical protein